MDEDRTYLATTIYIRKGFVHKQMSESMSESMSELERTRMKLIREYLDIHSDISSTIAAGVLDTQIKTAARLLAKAEKIGVLESRGKTRNKVYVLK